MKALVVIFGVICGTFVGFVCGILGAMGLGLFSKWMNPNDPSAGSVAIVVIETAPVGAMMGAVLGGLFIAKRPRLFLATVLPVAIVFVALQLTLSTLREHNIPRSYVLKVSGKNAEQFVGEIQVDGEPQKVNGNLPAEFEYQALEVEFVFALPNAKEGEKIAVEVVIDGRSRGKEEREKHFGAKYKSFGYSETFGGTSYWGGSALLPELRPASQK